MKRGKKVIGEKLAEPSSVQEKKKEEPAGVT
jgi:hypothetical protein